MKTNKTDNTLKKTSLYFELFQNLLVKFFRQRMQVSDSRIEPKIDCRLFQMRGVVSSTCTCHAYEALC